MMVAPCKAAEAAARGKELLPFVSFSFRLGALPARPTGRKKSKDLNRVPPRRSSPGTPFISSPRDIRLVAGRSR
jgi:hypothetical protein